jgi:hypothetical protein
MHMRLRPWRIALWLSVAAVLAGGPALAADSGAGSKNFRPPATVPNYFSNEAGPMIGGAAESQRGPLYSGQAASPARETRPVAAAMPRARQHLAMAEPRGHLLRGRHAAPALSRHVALHGVSRTRAAAHSVHTAGRTTHAAARKTRVTSAHHHARG